MAHLLHSRFPAAFSFATLLLGSCCANNVCDCANEQSDALKLVFDSTSTRKFNRADLDTIVLQRYPRVITRNTRPETVTIFRTAAQAYLPLYINNTSPFAQVGSSRLNQYRYYVRYFATPPQRRSKIVLAIDTVALKGSLDADGCCTCYNNTRKIVTTRPDSLAIQDSTKIINLNASSTPALIIRK